MGKKSKSDREIIVVGIVSYVIGLEKGKGEAIQVVDEGEIPNLVDNPYTLVINAYEIRDLSEEELAKMNEARSARSKLTQGNQIKQEEQPVK